MIQFGVSKFQLFYIDINYQETWGMLKESLKYFLLITSCGNHMLPASVGQPRKEGQMIYGSHFRIAAIY